jgi:Flp pilus assembly protein TadG
VALLETALCLAVLAPLAVVGARYAYAAYRLSEIENAVQEAARWASTAPAGESEEEFAARIRRKAAYANGEGGAPRVRGAGPEQFRVEWKRESGRIVAVKVSADGIRLEWPGGSRTLKGTPSAEMPRAR